MSLRANALRAMSGEDASLRGTLFRAALTVATPLYALGNAVNMSGYSLGFKKPKPLGRPTISIGNLTTGGTGKTPMVHAVVRHLAGLGHRPAVLLRGYRGGDEAEEHKRVLGELAHVEPHPDRLVGAQLALEADPSITCFVLDDGFQHRRAQRDLDLVLIDATNPWGFGHLLPRGLMREPRAALRRADAVVVTRADQVDPDALKRLDEQIRAITGRPPIAHAQHAWAGLRDASDNDLPLSTIADQNVMGVVGIGNPEAFKQTLERYAGQVLHCEAFDDHHAYTRKTLLRLIDLAKTADAKALVTTEKDWVKWSVLLEDQSPGVPIYRAKLAIGFVDGESAFTDLLSRAAPAPATEAGGADRAARRPPGGRARSS